ncbi:putative lipase/esterase [Nocardioides psychrotolerans]|uniref:Acetyl esterase n=1 Tax=Nocardioides psychrotolerans TaxID=1005945 RepID=A0A1I3N393_9ACTN|nr:alpha/beta hydrolase [Nocardioides psychrotolerans]GEP40467.1 putative lipase/esterase [Nocardioides psychrotolerans]SFJ03824.1 acetyl esterase [Nocardioides psychrotolerans]
MPLDLGTKSLLDFIAAAGYPPLHEGTPEAARRAMRAMSVDMVKPEDVIPVGSVEATSVAIYLPARVYRPEGSGPWPTLVFLHGGGFVIGDLDTHDQICRRLCAGAETVVVSVDYRLAPEAPYPAAVEDASAAVVWAAEHLAELGGGDLLAVGGDSAGGNLAAIVAQKHRDLVGAQVLIYPATHVLGDYPSRTENASGYLLEMSTMEWFFAHYGPSIEEVDTPEVSPLLGDLAGVAPAVLVTAEFDPLRDEGEAYADALLAAGVAVDRARYDGLIHGFLDMAAVSPAVEAALVDLTARTKALLHP